MDTSPEYSDVADSRALLERIRALEDEMLNRQKPQQSRGWYILLLPFSAICLLVASAIIGLLVRPSNQTIDTRQLTVRDAQGRQRAIIATDVDGRVFLSLLDGQGVARLQLRADDLGTPDIQVFNSH